MAILVATFLPASGIFFEVGTMMAERLLYAPSIGFCVAVSLAAHSVVCGWRGTHALSPTTAAGFVAAFAALVAAMVCQARARNLDWADDKSLFESAFRVCPRSVKVLLNMGILRRREMRWLDAIESFSEAQAIDDSFCDPDYWLGITFLNMGSAHAAVKHLFAALSCKYHAIEAAQPLMAALDSALDTVKPFPALYSVLMLHFGEQLAAANAPLLARPKLLQAGVNFGQAALRDGSGVNHISLDKVPRSHLASAQAYGLNASLLQRPMAELAYYALHLVHPIQASIEGSQDDNFCSFSFWFGFASLRTGREAEGMKWLLRTLRGPPTTAALTTAGDSKKNCNEFHSHAIHHLESHINSRLADTSDAAERAELLEVAGRARALLGDLNQAKELYTAAEGVRAMVD